MAELNLLPTVLNIECVVGDDVSVEVLITSGTGCNATVMDISGITFAAELSANGTIYPATVTKDLATGKVTAVWSDSQTSAAGPGSWKWWLKMTSGAITRTRLAGTFRGVSRG